MHLLPVVSKIYVWECKTSDIWKIAANIVDEYDITAVLPLLGWTTWISSEKCTDTVGHQLQRQYSLR